MTETEDIPPEGRARFLPDIGEVVAGSYDTVTVEYTVGTLGMDDGSSIMAVFSQTSDWSRPQFEYPRDDAYTTVKTSGQAELNAEYDDRAWKRPYSHGVRVDVKGGSIDPGETITLTIGDRSNGSMGQRQQTFVENGFEIRILADPVRTGEFIEVSRLTYDVVAGPPTRLDGILPSVSEVGNEVELRVRATDRWGNIATNYDGTVKVECEGEPSIDAETVRLEEGTGRTTFSLSEAGVYRLRITDDETGTEATTNPLVVGGDIPKIYWGDIHGQSGETVGTGTIQEYFEFARDCAFVDFAAHAGNDFQITDEFWDTIRDTVRGFNQPGEFVTFPCYEWSANAPAGGDHNVYFKDDEAAAGQEILRSHSWLVTDRDGERTDGVRPIQELYGAYEGRDDVLIIPHQGGRPADLRVHDPELTPFVEITSVWGVFEWFGRKAIDKGYEVGFVGSSDDHTGRPGVAWPDRLPHHNVQGGLMGVQTDSLERDALWDAFKDRRVYATTGKRILVDHRVNG
ncbi:MAG: DUF3604 domain-containing protein, partial [Halobacteria archaeon]|nr:DUF3604 domain-containing protein [Halobacteria archaeon]